MSKPKQVWVVMQDGDKYTGECDVLVGVYTTHRLADQAMVRSRGFVAGVVVLDTMPSRRIRYERCPVVTPHAPITRPFEIQVVNIGGAQVATMNYRPLPGLAGAGLAPYV